MYKRLCLANQVNHISRKLSLFFIPSHTFQSLYLVKHLWNSVVPCLSYWRTVDAFLAIWITQVVALSFPVCIPWPVRIVIDPKLIRSGIFCLNILLQCWIFKQSIIEIIPIELKGLWNRKPIVTEGCQVVGRPPLVCEARFTAQMFQGAQNEARPFLWVDQKPCLHFQRVEEGIKHF
jgi:hypothetical protein